MAPLAGEGILSPVARGQIVSHANPAWLAQSVRGDWKQSFTTYAARLLTAPAVQRTDWSSDRLLNCFSINDSSQEQLR